MTVKIYGDLYKSMTPTYCLPPHKKTLIVNQVRWRGYLEILGIPRNRIHLVQRHEKQMFAKTGGQPCVLIDDYSKNTREFSLKGGVGITFKNAGQVIAT